MKKILFLSLSLLFVLAGCSKDEKSGEIPALLEVEINTSETC